MRISKVMKKIFKKTLSVILTCNLLLQSYVPFLVSPVYADDSTPSAIVADVTPTPEVTAAPTAEITPTPEITAEPTPTPTLELTPTVEVTPEVTPTPTDIIVSDVTPTPSIDVTPTVEVTPTNSPEVSTETSPNTDSQAPPASDNSQSAPDTTPVTVPESLNIATQLEQTLAPVPTLSTDKSDYFPTDIAYISGSNFLPNTSYTLHISSSDMPFVSYKVEVTSDEFGHLSYAYQLDGNYRPSYSLDAIDASGAVVASMRFTDSARLDCGYSCPIVRFSWETREVDVAGHYVYADKIVDVAGHYGSCPNNYSIYSSDSTKCRKNNGQHDIIDRPWIGDTFTCPSQYSSNPGHQNCRKWIDDTYKTVSHDVAVEYEKSNDPHKCHRPSDNDLASVYGMDHDAIQGFKAVNEEFKDSTLTLPDDSYVDEDGICHAKTPVCTDIKANNDEEVTSQTYSDNSICTYDSHTYCSDDETIQVADNESVPEGATLGACQSGPVCGNEIVEGDEECDGGDHCSDNCTEKKINICHENEGKKDWVAISVNYSSWSTHESHGDFLYEGETKENGQPADDEWCQKQTPCTDTDDDGVCDEVDNCPQIANRNQNDENDNGIGDACEEVEEDKIRICHATSSETNEYEEITIAKSAVVHAHIEHQDTEDIIPPFDYHEASYSQNWPSGEDTWNNECETPNQEKNPEITISKSNNAGSDKAPGDSVVYTITLHVSGNNIHDLIVRDLLPKGFVYRAGSWEVTIDGLPVVIPEPVYHSPGTWNIPGVNAGQEVVLRYIADISGDEQAATYYDVASAEALSSGDNQILALAEGPSTIDDNFVGTSVNVVRDQTKSDDYSVEKKVEGQVLGASTDLPATGANELWLLASLLSLFFGLKLVRNAK